MDKDAANPCIRKDQEENTKDRKKQEHTKETGIDAETGHARNANSRTIFSNPVLTCQFLKKYTKLPVFSEITPEDIEDVSERYHAFLGVEFTGDTVKKVKIQHDGEEKEIFVISLIEHKSEVDYDVAMQLLRYIVMIWYDYAKKQNQIQKDANKRKMFRYPMIIPVVYYEGTAGWTADMQLAGRIQCNEELKQYVPDFTYKVISVHEYTQEDLENRQDEMSLVMMINQIQSPKDFSRIVEMSREFMAKVYTNAPAEIKKIYQEILWSLFMKMNLPTDEAQKMMNQLEENGMGELFANMEKMDIQEERRMRALAEQKAEMAEQKAETAEQKAETAEQKAKTAEQKAETAEQKAKKFEEKIGSIMRLLISNYKTLHMTKEEVTAKLQNQCGISEEEAFLIVEEYWNLE